MYYIEEVNVAVNLDSPQSNEQLSLSFFAVSISRIIFSIPMLLQRVFCDFFTIAHRL